MLYVCLAIGCGYEENGAICQVKRLVVDAELGGTAVVSLDLPEKIVAACRHGLALHQMGVIIGCAAAVATASGNGIMPDHDV